MTARQAITRVAERLAVSIPRLPDEPHISRRVRDLEAVLTLVDPPSRPSLDDLRARVVAAARTRDWSSLSRRDWSQVAWLLWVGNPTAAELPGLLEVYTATLESAGSASAVRRLIHVYLRDFRHELPGLSRIAALIRRKLSDDDAARGLDRWRVVHERFGLFLEREGVGRVAAAILDDRDPRGRELEAGLSGDLAGPDGFAGAVHLAVLHRLRQGLQRRVLRLEQIQRLLSSFEAQDGLRFPNRRRELVDALVLPWIETAPSSDIQRCLLEFLLRHLKHPRVHPGRWHDVSEAALGVVRKWLAQETLEEFFEIVDKSALDAHWRYRRAFWLAYFKRGALDDAWMALGPRASRTARAALGDGLACGHLRSGYGAQPTHSLLLMQIGELIVAEWSHDGKCRVWRRSDARAPKLGQNAYTRTEIVTASLQIVPTYSEDGIVHRSSEQGFWQGQLSQFIYRQTNIRVARREYMPNAR